MKRWGWKSILGYVIVAATSIAKVVWPESPVPELVLGLGGALGIIGIAHKQVKTQDILRNNGDTRKETGPNTHGW